AFLIHRIRSQSHEEVRARMLQLYKDAIRDSINTGIVSRPEVQRLEAIRDQMHVSQADHDRIMAGLDEETPGGAETAVVSPEKQLQLATYAEALAAVLARQRSSQTALDDQVIRALREEYAVTEAEHAGTLDRLMRRNEGIAAHLLDVPMAIEMACTAIEHLTHLTTPSAKFLTFLLQRRSERMADSLLRTVAVSGAEYDTLREGLVSHDLAARKAALARIGTRVSAAVCQRLNEGPAMVREDAAQHPELTYCLRRAGTSCPDPYVRAASLYTL